MPIEAHLIASVVRCFTLFSGRDAVSKSTLGRILAALVMVLALAGTTSLTAQTRAKIGVQVNVLFDLPALPFDIRVDGQYGQHKADLSGDVKTKLITGLVGAQIPLGPPGVPAKPYITGGIGVTNVDIGTSSFSASETKLSAGGGAGVLFSVGSVSLFIEARVMNVFTSGSDITILPITGGIMFGGK
jgi:hypothetical protein